mgnify:FL=1
MNTFIEDYLHDPTEAVASACEKMSSAGWYDDIDEEMIYRQIASPEFRLYEEIILSQTAEDSPRANVYASVA